MGRHRARRGRGLSSRAGALRARYRLATRSPMKTTDQLRAENQAIQERLAAGAQSRLRAIPGVVHVSVGLKQKAGHATDRLCIRVYVREKRNARDIPAA